MGEYLSTPNKVKHSSEGSNLMVLILHFNLSYVVGFVRRLKHAGLAEI